MKQKAINDFNKQKLHNPQHIKGGYANFCEWYLGLCDGDESASDIQRALFHMMGFDGAHDFNNCDPSILHAAYKKIKKYL